MKILSTDGLTKLIQLIKSNFIAKTDVEQTSEVTLATVATTGSYNDLIDKPSIASVDSLPNQNTNSGAISPLKLWQGTEYEWNHGGSVTWNCYQTNVQAMWVEQELPVATNKQIIFVHNKFFIWGDDPTSATRYCSADGTTWTECSLSVKYWSQPVYANNKFITIEEGTNGYIAYSDDGITWTESSKTFPIGGQNETYSLFYANNILITYKADFGNKDYCYSTDFGETWLASSYPNFSDINDDCRIYSHGKFIVWDVEGARLAYSTDGINWTTVTLPEIIELFVAGDDIFVYKGEENYLYYSTDCVNWTSISNNIVDPDFISTIAYGNGKFVGLGKRSNKLVITTSSDGINWTQTYTDIAYSQAINEKNLCFANNQFMSILPSNTTSHNLSFFSTDGINWTSYNLPETIKWNTVVGGNEIFINSNRNTTDTNGKTSAIFISSFSTCYILDNQVTTSSVVYDIPETISGKTVTQVNSNSIILSDNFTYNKNTSGNQDTYRSIGNLHPDYLCFINEVGIKLGNTTIA